MHSNALTAVFKRSSNIEAKKALSAFIERSSIASNGYTIKEMPDTPADAVYLKAAFNHEGDSVKWQISMIEAGDFNVQPDMTYMIWH